jgi:hypothetical protein
MISINGDADRNSERVRTEK